MAPHLKDGQGINKFRRTPLTNAACATDWEYISLTKQKVCECNIYFSRDTFGVEGYFIRSVQRRFEKRNSAWGYSRTICVTFLSAESGCAAGGLVHSVERGIRKSSSRSEYSCLYCSIIVLACRGFGAFAPRSHEVLQIRNVAVWCTHKFLTKPGVQLQRHCEPAFGARESAYLINNTEFMYHWT